MAYQIHQVKKGDPIKAQTTIEQDTQIKLNEENIDVLKNSKAPMIKNSASGAIASFFDGAEGHPIDELWVSINPVQEGTGEPSTENVRPITGWNGVHIVVSPTTDEEDEE